MANPAFTNNKAFRADGPQYVGFNEDLAPGIQPQGTMSYDGVIVKAASLFLLAVASAVLVGMFVPQLAFPLSMAAFMMSLVVIFGTKNEPKPALYAVTIALYGGAVGGLSAFLENEWSGIILQALIATAVVFAVSLAVYKSGRVRNIRKINRFLAIAVPSYVIFSLVNVAMVWFGGPNVREATLPGTGVPLGLILSAVAIFIGALMLISDFDYVDNGVRNQIPAKWEWAAAYGLVFAIIWIYLEMLRLLSYLRR